MYDPGNSYPKFIDQSIECLEDNLKSIPDVTTWAIYMGYSRSHFCTRYKHCFNEAPSGRLRKLRYKQLKESILKHPAETSYAIALRVGLRNDQALYKFLSTHYDTNFTELREKLLRGKD